LLDGVKPGIITVMWEITDISPTKSGKQVIMLVGRILQEQKPVVEAWGKVLVTSSFSSERHSH
jgi:hypothetical protein